MSGVRLRKHLKCALMGQLPPVLQGRRLAEPAPQSPPRRHGEQRATLLQVMVFICLGYIELTRLLLRLILAPIQGYIC
jgi:hypothetical protein